MARLPRLAVAGHAHLVIQRGEAARPLFVDDEDRSRYLHSLADVARTGGVAVHAFAILDECIELLVTPDVAGALGRFMQRLGRRYVRAFNQRHGTHGALWAGRFQAAAVDPEHYLLRAITMIEQAPVRAGLVAQPTEWVWSSARHHVGRGSSPVVTEHAVWWQTGNTPFEREARHEIDLQRLLRDDQVAEMLDAARGGWPLGSPEFLGALEQRTDRPVRPRPRGRPRRTGPPT